MLEYFTLDDESVLAGFDFGGGEIVHSNLGGMGPDAANAASGDANPPTIRYANVGSYSLPDGEVRYFAVFALGKLPPDSLAQHADALARCLEDSAWTARHSA